MSIYGIVVEVEIGAYSFSIVFVSRLALQARCGILRLFDSHT